MHNLVQRVQHILAFKRLPSGRRFVEDAAEGRFSIQIHLIKPPNAALQRPGDNCIVRQVVDERHADSGPLQALVLRCLRLHVAFFFITQGLRTFIEGHEQAFSSFKPRRASLRTQPLFYLWQSFS